MEIFWVFFQAISGILASVLLWLLLMITKDGISVLAKKLHDIDWRYDLLRNWYFVGTEDCANPDYVSLKFKNSKTDDEIKIGCERVKLP